MRTKQEAQSYFFLPNVLRDVACKKGPERNPGQNEVALFRERPEREQRSENQL